MDDKPFLAVLNALDGKFNGLYSAGQKTVSKKKVFIAK